MDAIIAGLKEGLPSSVSAPLFSSIEVAEAIKVLLGRGEILKNKLLTIDLLNQEYETFDL
jgi:molybdopterin/thiamine biosynthesis adenylyltransferase